MKRRTFELNEEQQKFLRMHSHPQRVWDFWRKLAHELDIDYRSIIAGRAYNTFTALPLNHNRPWCWPAVPLVCKQTAAQVMERSSLPLYLIT